MFKIENNTIKVFFFSSWLPGWLVHYHISSVCVCTLPQKRGIIAVHDEERQVTKPTSPLQSGRSRTGF